MALSPRLLRPKASGAAFDPRSIPGILAWYDAADLATLAQNSDGTTPATAQSDPVGYLRDKGPNGYHMTQSTNNSRPLLQLNDQNGRHALLFDGSNDFLINTQDFLNGFAASIVVVAKRTSDTNVAAVVSTGRLGLSGATAMALDLRNTFLTPADRLGITPTTGATVRRNGAASLLTGNSPTSYMIGCVALGTAINSTVSGDGVSLGVGRSSTGSLSFYLSGAIAEVVLYSSALSITQLQSLERYMSAKWGIQLE